MNNIYMPQKFSFVRCLVGLFGYVMFFTVCVGCTSASSLESERVTDKDFLSLQIKRTKECHLIPTAINHDKESHILMRTPPKLVAKLMLISSDEVSDARLLSESMLTILIRSSNKGELFTLSINVNLSLPGCGGVSVYEVED